MVAVEKTEGRVTPAGDLRLRVVPRDEDAEVPLTLAPTIEMLRERLREDRPRPKTTRKAPLAYKIRNLPNRMRGMPGVVGARLLHRFTGVPVMIGTLRLRLIDNVTGEVTDYGIVGQRVVTTVGVGFIVDAFQNLVEVENMKFHGFGTGGAAEGVGNTALTTELTTQYAVDSTRPTGTQTETGGNAYRTVGTLDPDADVAITEHGILDQAATGGGVLLDRTLFAVINVTGAGTNTLEATYDLTFPAGS